MPNELDAKDLEFRLGQMEILLMEIRDLLKDPPAHPITVMFPPTAAMDTATFRRELLAALDHAFAYRPHIEGVEDEST